MKLLIFSSDIDYHPTNCAYESAEFSRISVGYSNQGGSYRQTTKRRLFFSIPFASADVAIELTAAAGLQTFRKRHIFLIR
ncbi:hypothetical protein PUN28_005141 [Cardiocondyla obscurior]|uniref:Uncharacterized protein n=1 Tax=Cardiocondyla obscurior TaxID=286306 RepID=A0AAW2GGA0_9HYME